MITGTPQCPLQSKETVDRARDSVLASSFFFLLKRKRRKKLSRKLDVGSSLAQHCNFLTPGPRFNLRDRKINLRPRDLFLFFNKNEEIRKRLRELKRYRPQQRKWLVDGSSSNSWRLFSLSPRATSISILIGRAILLDTAYD